MIKIENPNIDKIALDYFDKIKVLCIQRAEFSLKVLNVLFNHLPISNLEEDTLNGHTRKSVTNVFLNLNKISKLDEFNRAVVGNCHTWVNTHQIILTNISIYLSNEKNLMELILGKPYDALRIENDIKILFGINDTSYLQISPVIKSIINYDLFDKFAYSIGAKLQINTCPYCNRVYINTIIGVHKDNIIRPTFDHFFSQKNHPLLSLSFYNLIPSCYYCNSNLKGSHEMCLEHHLHPYLDGFDNDFLFNFLIVDEKANKSHPDNYKIFIKSNLSNTNPKFEKVLYNENPIRGEKRGNANLFKLNEIYQSHRDVVGELIVKCDSLSKGYSNSLHEVFGLLNTNKAEFYRYHFGNYFNEKDFHRRPLAKLSKDIVSQVLPHFLK